MMIRRFLTIVTLIVGIPAAVLGARAAVSQARAAVSQARSVHPLSPIAWWPLNEASAATSYADAAGGRTMGQGGTANTITLAAGITNYGVTLAAAQGNFIKMAANDATLSPGTNPFTVAAWFNPATITAARGIFTKYATSGNQREWLLYLNSATPTFILSNDGTATQSRAWSGTVTASAWHLAIAWMDPAKSVMGLQVDGGTPVTSARSTAVFASTTIVQIGTGGGINSFDGVICDPMYFNRVLTDGERLWLYNSGTGRVNTGSWRSANSQARTDVGP